MNNEDGDYSPQNTQRGRNQMKRWLNHEGNNELTLVS